MSELRPLSALEKIQEAVEYRLGNQISGAQMVSELSAVTRSLDQALSNLRAVQFPADFAAGPPLQAQALDALEMLAGAMDRLAELEHEVHPDLAREALHDAKEAYQRLEDSLQEIRLRRQQT
jgi:hypothetical protein